MNCDRCGCDAEEAVELYGCPECDRTLCERCYGDPGYEWCRACRRIEDRYRRAAAAALDKPAGEAVQ